MRVNIAVNGAARAELTIDPLEFVGMDRREIAHELRNMLNFHDPEVDWFPEEVDGAVDEIFNVQR